MENTREKILQLHPAIRDLIEFYQWLMFNENLGDASYLDYACLVMQIEKVLYNKEIKKEDLPQRTNAKNNFLRYFELSRKINLDSFKRNIFFWDEIKFRKGAWCVVEGSIQSKSYAMLQELDLSEILKDVPSSRNDT